MKTFALIMAFILLIGGLFGVVSRLMPDVDDSEEETVALPSDESESEKGTEEDDGKENI